MAKPETIDLLETFWRRRSFHDMAVESISAVNRRVVIRLEHYTLIVTQVTKLVQEIEELPTAWLNHKWTDREQQFVLYVELELGKFEVWGSDVRLLRNSDLSVLIPAIDA